MKLIGCGRCCRVSALCVHVKVTKLSKKTQITYFFSRSSSIAELLVLQGQNEVEFNNVLSVNTVPGLQAWN